MSFPWLASVLQSSDPLFPIGSYAHSYGLEELAAEEAVTDAASLLDHLQNHVALNLQEFELPYLRFAYEAIRAADFELLCVLDDEIGASKLAKELRAASSAQGQQRLRLLEKIRPSATTARLADLQNSARIVPQHLSVFAAEYADLGAPLEAALAGWAYQALAAPCAAALKLIRIGQEGAQAVLTHALQMIDPIIEASRDISRERAGALLPALDIAAFRHERAHARLFIS